MKVNGQEHFWVGDAILPKISQCNNFPLLFNGSIFVRYTPRSKPSKVEISLLTVTV